MKVYEIIKRKALKERNAVRYFVYCMSLQDMPEDVELYKTGYRQVYGIDMPEDKLERIMKGFVVQEEKAKEKK